MKNNASGKRATCWHVSPEASPDHTLWADHGRRLFATAAWARVLRVLGAEPVFAWHPQQGIGAVVPVFRRFGLRIGFLGFPVAGEDFDRMTGSDLAQCAASIAKAARLDLMRTAISLRNNTDPQAVAGRPEVWIEDLQNWRLTDHKRLRKDLAFARRSAPDIELVQSGFDPIDCFRLYASTVARHGGQRRYGPEYFSALQSLASVSRFIGFFASVERGAVRGFAVVAAHGQLAYYLHGAVDAVGRRQGISDLLLERLLTYAHDTGATRFTFMSSPWKQQGLLHFKRKWADSTGLSVTYDHGYSLLGSCAVLASRWQRRYDRHRAALYATQRETSLED